MYLFFWPFAIAILLMEERRVKIGLLRCLLLSAGSMILIAPWSVYSSLRAGTLIIISANGGETLAGGLGPRLLTYGQDQNPMKMRNAWNGLGKWLGPTNIERAKVLYMWGFWPFSIKDRQTVFGGIPVLISLLLSFFALVRFSKYFRELSRFWTLPIFVTIVALFSWGSWRFRQPADIGLLALSALLLWSLQSRGRRHMLQDETGARTQIPLSHFS
jgi:hypothetical protein